jgi:tetratricopeptide (TPR) repeat protein
MKNRLAVLATALLISSTGFAQKDELKTLKRIHDKDQPSEKDIVEYKATLVKAQPLMSAEADKVYYNYYKAEAPIMELLALMAKPENQSKPQLATQFITPEKIRELTQAYTDVKAYESKTGKQAYSKAIDERSALIAPTLLNYAVGMGSQKKYAEGAKVLYDIYQLDKKQPDNLYYAASYAVNGQDYDSALKYYDELKAINYSGAGTTYLATSVATGKEEPFNNKADRDKMVAFKTHVKPREEKTVSKRGEIYKNIALILMQKNKIEEAKTAYAEAIKENPDDTSLSVGEANLYLQLKDTETYKSKVAAILAKNPNNIELIYNMGVVALEAHQPLEAEGYFKKVLEIDPKYANAYMNLAAIKLEGDEKVVAEMNKLGTSEKDNKRYETLKKQRTASFNAAMPYLEKALELDATNEAVIDNLLSVYNFLELNDTEKYKTLKAKKKAMQQ